MEWRNLSVRDRAGLIRQMVSLGITTSNEQEKFYNDSIANPTNTFINQHTAANGGPIRFYHNDNKGKNQYINKNHYYRTQKGSYGVNATPFIEEKVYPYGPVWKGDMRDYRQEITGRTYDQKYSEGLNIVPNIIGNVLELPTSRLQSQQKVINTYNPQGTLLKQVVKTYDHSLPLGQRRTKSVYDYANPGMKLFAPELNLYNSTNAADVLNSVNRR